MTPTFAPDPRIEQVAEAYALDAVDFAKSAFRLKLDWSDESVRHVETMLAELHNQVESAQPDEEKIFTFGKMFGSYVGEVYRKRHGGVWGMVTLDGQTFTGMQAPSGTNFWPWGRAQNRIVNGPEDNIWHYYQILVGKGRPATASPALAPPEQQQEKPWWKRLFGG